MARCLRCKAGNEWIEGDVKDEPRTMDRMRLLEALLAEAVRLLKLDGVIFDPTDCIKQSERALKASTSDRSVDK